MGGQASVSTQASDDGRMVRLVINEISNQVSRNQGQIPKALSRSSNIQFKAGS